MKINENKLKNYSLNIILIWAIVVLYQKLPYYQNFLRTETQTTIIILALSYTIFGAIYYLLTQKQEVPKSKGRIILESLIRTIKNRFNKPKQKNTRLTKQEKIAMLFVMVKIFYLPIMLNFIFNNFYFLKYKIETTQNFLSLFTFSGFDSIFFPGILALIFFLDTLWFGFGYAFEAGFLKNKIISVEPTFLGWFVALICYPPFNSIATKNINWFANEYILFGNGTITIIMRVVIMLLLATYLSATFALGTRCSNLTNRGIVTRGPYKFVRHPAYISKNLVWWITIIPVISWPAIISMGAWSIIYHLRTITEENHLKKDPNYIKYCKKVKYRYIPKIY